MPNGKKLNASAADIAVDAKILDPLATPKVATPTAAELRGVVASLGRDAGATVEAKTTETTGSSTETVVEKDTEEDENGSKETTTTTTTETNYSSSEDDSEPDGDEEGDDDDDDGDGKDAIAAAPTVAASSSPPARLTSGDVLALVRELTGTAKPAEQLGALRAMHDNAKRAAKAEKRAEKSTREAKVDAAIRAGKLAPAQRKWALGVDAGVLDGYLATAAPLVKRAPTSSATEAAAAPNAAPTAAAVTVAAAMGMDPKALEAHAAELRKSGALH